MIPFVINLVYFLLCLALVLAFIRLTRGPSLPDRVVALELVASIVVGFVGVHAIDTGVASLADGGWISRRMPARAGVQYAMSSLLFGGGESGWVGYGMDFLGADQTVLAEAVRTMPLDDLQREPVLAALAPADAEFVRVWLHASAGARS